ncbi:hypothetical protein B0H15DRAFT_783322 [Mycena belliarum]|uniref:Uncharacterized protein n=1 Tax=Mycena belliarum TaxID=1033014 RepID=A0AAD6U008_9AGAR|nr:hypothetical protein B0H15DRAFT_783322 [Mycena belliae]
MDVSLEAYRNIVRSAARRSDIAALCGVSRAFRRAAERALYNTLHISDADPRLAETLAGSPRLAALVEALTVQVARRGAAEDEGDSEAPAGELPPLDAYWATVARALRHMPRLRHLTVDIADPAETRTAWVLGGAPGAFQLRTFQCDFDWDPALAAFLGTQHELHDLALRDYRALADPRAPPVEAPDADSDIPPPHDTPALPRLATLECTFSAAAAALAPGRPLTRLKTCFSTPDAAGKRAELAALLAALRRAARPLRALDMADARYTPSGALALLRGVAHAPAAAALRFLGTLALPVAGRKRLQLYALLMRLPHLRCVELDVSAWAPPPAAPAALRALAGELRLYCARVDTVVFVREFARTVVSAAGAGGLRVDGDARPEDFWREV